MVKLESGGGGLDPYIPFPFTIFKDNALLLLPLIFDLLQKCFAIDLSGIDGVAMLEGVPRIEIKCAEVS